MPQPPVDPRWVKAVTALLGFDDRMKAAKIRSHLERAAEAKGSRYPGKVPHLRTIERIRAKVIADAARTGGESLTPYREFHWPETMESGALPWEAASALFELVGYFRMNGDPVTIRRARWFWYVTLACPEAPFEDRRALTTYLIAAEDVLEGMRSDIYRHVEGKIVCAPWRSAEHRQEFEDALASGVIPRLPAFLTDLTDLEASIDYAPKLLYIHELLRSRFEPKEKDQ
jgi:hypothetical protein